MSLNFNQENNKSNIQNKLKKIKRISTLILENNKNVTSDSKLSTLITLNSLKHLNTHKKEIIEELSKILKTFKEFFYFLKYNKINDTYLHLLIEEMEYERYLKGLYLFNKGDNLNKFYLILKGKVTFKEFNPKLNKEIEIIKSSGNYFGVKKLMYDKKQNKSAFAIEETHLFTIIKDSFKKILGKILFETELRKKEFLYKTIPIFSKCLSYKIDYIINNNIKTKFYTRNEIIYNEGERTGHFYIIYNGTVKLMKNLLKINPSIILNKEESINEIIKKTGNINYNDLIKKEISKIDESISKKYYMINSRELTKLINLTSGGIGGLELSAGIDKMKYTMVCDCEFLIIFDLNLINICDYLDDVLKSCLPLFIHLEKSIENTICQIKKIEKKIIPRNLRKYSSFSLKKDRVKEINEKFNEGCYYNMINSINKKFEKNKDGFIKLNANNKILCYEKEILEDKKDNNLSFTRSLNNYINSAFLSKKNSKQNVKFIKKENNFRPVIKMYKKFHINYNKTKKKLNIFPKLSFSSTVNCFDNINLKNEKLYFKPFKYIDSSLYNTKKNDNSKEKKGNSYNLNIEKKRIKSLNLFPFNNNIIRKTYKKYYYLKKSNSTKNILQNESICEIFNKIIENKKIISYNSGSFEIPLTSDL